MEFSAWAFLLWTTVQGGAGTVLNTLIYNTLVNHSQGTYRTHQPAWLPRLHGNGIVTAECL